MFHMRDPKIKKIISTVIVVLLRVGNDRAHGPERPDVLMPHLFERGEYMRNPIGNVGLAAFLGLLLLRRVSL